MSSSDTRGLIKDDFPIPIWILYFKLIMIAVAAFMEEYANHFIKR